MKYIKTFEGVKFKVGVLAVPLNNTKYASKDKVYKVHGRYSPEYCKRVLKYNGWAYSLYTDYEYDTTLFKDSELRHPTPEELEVYMLTQSINNTSKKYNL